MNCVCSFDGTPQEIDGKFIYTGGKNRLRHIKKDVPFEEFVKIMEEISSNDKTKSKITVKHMISGILCDVVDNSDYQAMFMSYLSNPQVPLQIWIVKENKSPRGQSTASGLPHRTQGKRNVNINDSQREPTTHAENIEPYVPLRNEGGIGTQSAADVERVKHGYIRQAMDDDTFLNISVSRREGGDNNVTGAVGGVGVDVSDDSSNVDNISNAHYNECASDIESSESDRELKVGQLYLSRNELMDKLRTYAIFHRFEFKHVAVNPRQITVSCMNQIGCSWRLYAKKLSDAPTFEVITYNPIHTCSKQKETTKSRQASSEWIARKLSSYIKDDSNAKEIQLEVKRKFGIDVSYKTAWRAKDMALQKRSEDFIKSYQMLVSYIDELKGVDPDSVTKLETEEGNKFRRFFWTYGPTIRAVKNNLLRRSVIVDGTVRQGKARGTIMTAIALDGDDCIFPLAFAIVKAEDDESWTFFLKNLRDHVVGDEPLVIQSGMSESIIYAVPHVFQNAIHTYCLHEIAENIPGGLEEIKNKFMAAAQEPSVTKFQMIMSSISVLHPRAYKYLHDIGEDHWAELHIQRHGRRYGIVPKGYVETWNKMIKRAVNDPITNLVGAIHDNCSAQFAKYMKASVNLTSRLTGTAENRLVRQSQLGKHMKMVPSSMTLFQVISEKNTYGVDLDKRECTCNWWQMMGLPCCHALKCISAVKLCVYDFCERWYTKETYSETYKEVLKPIKKKEDWVSDPLQQIVKPPSGKCGRPSNLIKKRKRSREGAAIRYFCSKCNDPGHNRASCTAESA